MSFKNLLVVFNNNILDDIGSELDAVYFESDLYELNLSKLINPFP